MNRLYCADCVEASYLVAKSSVDLIYLDPPYNTGRFMGTGPKGYPDSWHSIQHYSDFMEERLMVLHRLLKPTGAIFLHCDTSNEYLLRGLMNGIFGERNWLNTIVWCYTGAGSGQYRRFPRKHDVLLFFAKNKKRHRFYPDSIRIPYPEATLERMKYPINNQYGTAGGWGNMTPEQLEAGKVPEDHWTDIPAGGQIPQSEATGYATQKPEKLLERVIKSCTQSADVVLDPFNGSGTCVTVSEKLQRHWIGFDINKHSIELTTERLNKLGMFVKPFRVIDNYTKEETIHHADTRK